MWPATSQVTLGVEEAPGDGGEAARLVADFGADAVGVSAGGGGGGGSAAVGVDAARRLLTKFAFPASRWQDEVSRLSGGERRRLQLLACLAARPNVLVLVSAPRGSNPGRAPCLASFAGALMWP